MPLDITFPSAHHSPKTVNKNAKEFVIGTVRLSSATGVISIVPNHHPLRLQSPLLTRPTLQPPPYPPSSSTPKPREKKKKRRQHLPALPISKKNHTLPVKFTTNGTAYAGLLNRSATVHTAFRTLHLTHPAFDRVSMRSREG